MVEVGQILEVVQRAANCHSGMLEYPVPSTDQEAVEKAAQAGLMEVIANGVAQVSLAGREYVA